MTVVGIIGLGNMGSAIAERLIAGGIEVVGFDIAPPEELAHLPLELVAAADTVAERAELILLSLPSAQALSAVVAGPAGLEHAIGPQHVLAETSTLSVSAKRSAEAICAARGAALLDCALSGTPTSTRAGELSAFASGDEAAFERMCTVFEAFTRTTRHVGEFGSATGLKLICNLLVMIHDAATAEAMALGIAAGFDPQLVYDAVCSGIASSRVFEQRGAMMVQRDFRPGSRSYVLAIKDGALIEELAATHGAFAPMFQIARQMHLAGLGLGHGEFDAASLVDVYRALSA
jgi:3-hydroxyisobutyrate dehydrogenase-like beta-hydroxyacid dehydrogenase